MARLDDLDFGMTVWVKDRRESYRNPMQWVEGTVVSFGDRDWVGIRTQHFSDAYRCGEIKLVKP